MTLSRSVISARWLKTIREHMAQRSEGASYTEVAEAVGCTPKEARTALDKLLGLREVVYVAKARGSVGLWIRHELGQALFDQRMRSKAEAAERRREEKKVRNRTAAAKAAEQRDPERVRRAIDGAEDHGARPFVHRTVAADAAPAIFTAGVRSVFDLGRLA